MSIRRKEEFVKRSAEEFGGGRKAPYSISAIRSRMCSRAGCTRMSFATWQACCDDRLYRPICAECDIELNRTVLEWWGDPDWERKIVEYANGVQADLDRLLELDWLERESVT